MSGGQIVKDRLKATAAVTALVGAPPNDRIHRFWLPQDSPYPAIAYKRIAERTLRGTYSNPGVHFETIQVISLAETADQAGELDRQARIALERFGSAQPAGIPFAGVTLYDIVLGASAEGYADEAKAHFVSTDFTINWQEP